MATAQDVINEAEKWAKQRYKEAPANSNNSIFGAWYGANHQPWCAMFVSYCMNKAGAGKLIAGAQSKKGYASCGAGIRFFKKRHAYFAARDARPGDHAFFDWDHDGSQDHVGLVLKVDAKRKRILTIEGNTGAKNLSNGGMVAKQWRNMSVIMGVGRPAYDLAAAPAAPVAAPAAPAPAPAPVVAPKPAPAAPAPKPATPKPAAQTVLKLGSKGAAVKRLQTLLHITADGAFGPKTQAAVKTYQAKHGLAADGVVGPATWEKLGN